MKKGKNIDKIIFLAVNILMSLKRYKIFAVTQEVSYLLPTTVSRVRAKLFYCGI
jgi:hypothetical protein